MTSEQLDRWESEIRRRDHDTTHWDGCEESHPRCRELALIARVRALEDVLSVIASPGSIEDYGNGWAVEKARAALTPKGQDDGR